MIIPSSLLLLWSLFSTLKSIPLPAGINSVHEEFSGMAWTGGRLYLLPQFGNHKETGINGAFDLYSLRADSISRVIEDKDTALTHYRKLSVKRLSNLPDSVKRYYQGFEAIAFNGSEVHLAMETADVYPYCFLLKGTLDTAAGQILIDTLNIVSLKRFPEVSNAGFESLAYLPGQQALLAVFEYNAVPGGGTGYLVNPSFQEKPQTISIPFIPFRITDIQAAKKGRVYAINYYWSGDYKSYIKNKMFPDAERKIKQSVPDLKKKLNDDAQYLEQVNTTYGRIVYRKRWNAGKWKQVTSFNSYQNNWEGLALFKDGALLITDANESEKQLATLSYVAF